MRRVLSVAIWLAWSLSESANAVIMRHDRDPNLYLQLARNFPSAVQLHHADSKTGAEGTLIGARWVLTAAHVANNLNPGDVAVVQGKNYPIKRLALFPGWHQDADMPLDIALVELAEPVTDVVPAQIYKGTDELGMFITNVGRGVTGDGLHGPSHEDGRVRAATNRIESTFDVFPSTAARGQYPAEGFQLRTTFDAPGAAQTTELEGCGGEGDSGAGAYIKKDGVLYVIGVGSGEDTRPNNHQFNHYGIYEYYTRVSHFADWIEHTIATAEATP